MGIRFWEGTRFKRKNLSAILFGIVMVLLLVIIGLSLTVFPIWGRSGKGHSWSRGDCSIKCNKIGFDRKPLLVISLDGFKRSYIDRGIVKTLELTAKCGTTSEYMYPSFPSRTFPNHYAIATGLYPESSGIVDNAVYDERFATQLVDVRRAKDERYFDGIPIWNVLERQGIITACIFWAGCDLPINGMQPTYLRKYNRSMPYRDRIDQILTWLTMPVKARPALIMSYFDQPDQVGHFHSSEEEVDKQLENIESMLNYLFQTLHEMNLLNCINIIILSDHGMQKLDRRYYLDELIDPDSGTLFAGGVIGRIHFPNNSDSSLQIKVKETMEKLACINTTHYRRYDRSAIPRRYHFSATDKVGDLILEGQPGTIFFENRARSYKVTHDHGYDFILPSMRTIFYARGPNIAQGLTVKPFQNIELFNLMAVLLRLDSGVPPNNGTEGRLNSVLKDIPMKKPARAEPLRECTTSGAPDARESCISGSSSLISGNGQFCYMSRCSAGNLSSALFLSSDTNRVVALIERINYEIFTSEKSRKETLYEKVVTASFSMQGSGDLNVSLYSDFVEGHFADIQNLTLHYAKAYGELLLVNGPIYDFDNNGLADTVTPSQIQRNTMASHIFWIIFRCDRSEWLPNKFQCKEPKSLRTLPFILPNIPHDYNCLDSLAYLTTNVARLRDIELATGLEFFPTSQIPMQELYDDDFAITLRTAMPEQLWPVKAAARTAASNPIAINA